MLWTLVKAQLASKHELETCYTLDEAMKLYALYRMDCDIQAGSAEEVKQ